MRLTAALLVLCVFAAAAESQSVTVRGATQQKSAWNVLTKAVSGIQHAVASAVGSVLGAAATLVHKVIGAAESAVVAAIEAAEKLAGKLVNHNAFAVRILQCLADTATQAANSAADTAHDALDRVQGAVAGARKQQAAAAQKSGLLTSAGGAVLKATAGAVKGCVVEALHETVQQLDHQAHRLVGNSSRAAVSALQVLDEAIEKHVKGNPAVLQSLDEAVDTAVQVVRNLTHQNSKRNLLNDLVDQLGTALAENLARWIRNATSAAEIKVEDFIAQAEKAFDEALQKAQQAVDVNPLEGSDWEKALEAVLKKAGCEKGQLTNNGDRAVRSTAEVAQQVSH